jgi:hypothetical protein
MATSRLWRRKLSFEYLDQTKLQRKEFDVRSTLCTWWNLNKSYFPVRNKGYELEILIQHFLPIGHLLE